MWQPFKKIRTSIDVQLMRPQRMTRQQELQMEMEQKQELDLEASGANEQCLGEDAAWLQLLPKLNAKANNSRGTWSVELKVNETPAKTITISNLSSTLTTSTNSEANRRHAVPLMPGKHKFYAKKLNQVPSPLHLHLPCHGPRHIPSVKHTGVDHLDSHWGSFCLLPDCA
ncbi:hypothetical protein ACLKA7_008046 [Drosophila subpalustris]